jgi:type IV pilus assembly protein PilQ
MRKILVLYILMFSLGLSKAQTTILKDRVAEIKAQLISLSDSASPGLKERVSASVDGVRLSQFIRGMAISNGLNITVDPELDMMISVNFNDEIIVNILTFLVKQYRLDVEFVGSIMYITKYQPPPPPTVPPTPLGISYDNKLLTLDLKEDTLFNVAKYITELTGRNVVLAPGLNYKSITAYVQNESIDQALKQMAFANQLSVIKGENNEFYIQGSDQKKLPVEPKKDKNAKAGVEISITEGEFEYLKTGSKKGKTTFDITAEEVPKSDIIKYIARDLKVDYFLFQKPEGKASLSIRDASFEELLNYLLDDPNIGYSKDGDVFLIGENKRKTFAVSELVQLQNRSLEFVTENIPQILRENLEIKRFDELNSLVVSGPEVQVANLVDFIQKLDKVVPVITIEVLIVDINNNRTVKSGIAMGLSEEPVSSSGTILPGLDLTLGSGAINNMIDVINGWGVFNLGEVTPNFYMSIQAMEEGGILKVRSTPKLSTLNGHEATLSIGRTDYYVEETNNIIGTQNPQSVVTRTFKPIEANFSLTINPTVSGDNHVTMDIAVNQSDFTNRISPDAPPGSTSREFESSIRVRNNEMIVLGGLEELQISNTGSGLPLVSRIPILRWFFGNREKSKSKTKLTIFIKPSIIY